MQKRRERERERERDGKEREDRKKVACRLFSAAIGIYRPPGSVSITNSSNFNHYLP